MRRALGLVLLLLSLATAGVSAQVLRLRFLATSTACVGTVINVGDTWQTVVSAAAVGTTFCIQPGIHRLQSVTALKNNQTFIGTTGAILSGAKVLTGVTGGSGTNPWIYTGQTQQGIVDTSSGTACQPGHDPTCAQPEDVFYDGVPLRAVGSLAAGGTGTFFFDYAADTIAIWDTPIGHLVETSVTPIAFLANGATGVTIKTLTIQNFATPTGQAAVQMGPAWVVDGAEVRFNHYAGINSTTNGIVRNSHVHHNGAFGLNGSGSFLLIDTNEVDHNNAGVYAFYNPGQGAGGSKWVFTDNLIVRGNYSHDNYGPGLWTDINNITVLYENNRVDTNFMSGIFQEVGYDAIIRNNTLTGNGTSHLFPGYVEGACILVSSSRNVEVYGNTCTDNWQGIAGLDTGRSGEGDNNGPWLLTNLNVHDNTISQATDLGAGSGISGLVSLDSVTLGTFGTGANNRYAGNEYTFGSYLTEFNWSDGTYTDLGWYGFGMDTAGAFHRSTGINRVQQASASVFADNPQPMTVTFPKPVTTGHLGVVVVRGATAATVTGVTDTLGTSYSLVATDASHDPFLYLYAGTFSSSGANTVTPAWSNANVNYAWAQVLEARFASSPATASAFAAFAAAVGTTDQTCAALTSASPAYLVMATSQSGLSTYTAGTDSLTHAWSLINGSIGTTPNLFGGVQDYLAAATYTSGVPHIVAASGTDPYTTVCAAFKP